MSKDIFDEGTRVDLEEEPNVCDYCGADEWNPESCTGECQLERDDEEDPDELDFSY